MSDGGAMNDDVGSRNALDFNDANEVDHTGSDITQEEQPAAVNEDSVSVPSSPEPDTSGTANETTAPSDMTLGENRGEILDEQYNNVSVPSPNDTENGSSVDLDGNEQERRQEEEESGVFDEELVIAEVASRRIRQFLETHKQWRIRNAILNKETSGKPGERIAILNAMANSLQVELHSLKTTTNHNGQVGTVVQYLMEKDRFAVKLNDQEFALRADNLRVLSKESNESKDETSLYLLPLSLDNLVKALFCNGMLFKGTISIPGLVGQRREYQLVVESFSVMDEMGRSVGILARHKAYDDEQYVYIQVDKSSDYNLSIQFADGETQCNGTWNMETRMFEGNVRQLIPTEDGGSIYYAQDKVTHTFTLSPTTAMHPNGIAASLHSNVNEEEETSEDNGNDIHVERAEWEHDLISKATRSIANLRHETDQLGFELIDKCEYMCAFIDSCPMPLFANENLQSLASRLVLEVRCKELVAIDSLAAEKTCALFRRWSSLLDKLTFVSEEERATVLTKLQEKGMARVRAHKESDARKERARQVVETWGTLSSDGSPFSFINRPNRDDMTRILVMCARLDQNYKRFDEALRRAEERLTDDDFQQWIVSNQINEHDALCTICHVPLRDGDSTADKEEVLCLPCSHRFHIECLREWLHHHSQCPVCRLELRK